MKLIIDLLKGLFDATLKRKETPQTTPTERPLITLDDWITSSGRYKERANSSELTQEVKDNASILIGKVNALLAELGVEKVKVSSGYRPSAVNAKVVGAAKKSGHMTGFSIDLEDNSGELDKLIGESEELLKEYGLWQEHPSKTVRWSHLDMVIRPERVRPGCNSRQFLP